MLQYFNVGHDGGIWYFCMWYLVGKKSLKTTGLREASVACDKNGLTLDPTPSFFATCCAHKIPS